jgi:hypothetical protein
MKKLKVQKERIKTGLFNWITLTKTDLGQQVCISPNQLFPAAPSYPRMFYV